MLITYKKTHTIKWLNATPIQGDLSAEHAQIFLDTLKDTPLEGQYSIESEDES